MSELCFIIDDRYLYMDQVLIDYNDDPVFYRFHITNMK